MHLDTPIALSAKNVHLVKTLDVTLKKMNQNLTRLNFLAFVCSGLRQLIKHVSGSMIL